MSNLFCNSTALPPGVIRRGDDLYFLREAKEQENEGEEADEEIFLCGGHFDVIANVRDETGDYFHLVQFFDVRRNKIQLQVALQSSSKTILSTLKRKGLKMARKKSDRELLIEFIDQREVTRRISSISHRWHNGCYLTSRGTIGPTSNEEIMFDESFVDTLSYCGDLDGANGWRSTLGAACVGNRLLTFGVCVGLSSVVLTPMQAPCIGFLLYGGSGLGKSTTTDAARSVTGTPFRTCLSTQNGIETVAYESSDSLLTLDELGLANPKLFGENAYMLGNGEGKIRYGRKSLVWKLAWIVNGEKTLLDFMADNGIKMMEGQEVRLLSIPADVGKGLGSFDTIQRYKTPEEFAEAIAKWARTNQGVAAETFLENVTADLDSAVRKMNETRVAFASATRQKHGLENASALVGRALGHFAIVAAAGELATEFGVTGWPQGEAMRAVSATFESWFFSQYKLIKDRQKDVEQVRGWIEANKGRLQTSADKDGSRQYLIDVDEFRNEACAGLDYLQVARQLKAEGNLIHNNDGGLTLQRRDGARRYNVYCVRLSGGDTGDAGDKGA